MMERNRRTRRETDGKRQTKRQAEQDKGIQNIYRNTNTDEHRNTSRQRRINEEKTDEVGKLKETEGGR